MNLSELPGSELILPGLDDLHNGEARTIGVFSGDRIHALNDSRLRCSQRRLAPEPELTLYARLQDEQDDAYPYYNALLNNLNSFCNALEKSSVKL